MIHAPPKLPPAALPPTIKLLQNDNKTNHGRIAISPIPRSSVNKRIDQLTYLFSLYSTELQIFPHMQPNCGICMHSQKWYIFLKIFVFPGKFRQKRKGYIYRARIYHHCMQNSSSIGTRKSPYACYCLINGLTKLNSMGNPILTQINCMGFFWMWCTTTACKLITLLAIS